MKVFTAAVLLLFLSLNLSLVALAKPNPAERLNLSFMNADINIGSAGDEKIDAAAMRERSYFFAPMTPFSAGAFSCRLKEILFYKTRLAQTCP